MGNMNQKKIVSVLFFISLLVIVGGVVITLSSKCSFPDGSTYYCGIDFQNKKFSRCFYLLLLFFSSPHFSFLSAEKHSLHGRNLRLSHFRLCLAFFCTRSITSLLREDSALRGLSPMNYLPPSFSSRFL